ncbi:Helix-turn-helix domain protein [Rubripirellula obstinata]|uniref:Helix-turn-helix domain protein n=1 Tax=Rubripirellula obstinata TaxID=406547 RepID=A0A5B1CG95_9BACT|nr:Helix-turn-helix domain protein [Rubripirellula obstinata]
MSDQPWLSPKQAAEILSVHPQTIRRAIKRGALQATHLSSRQIRISRESLNDYLGGAA